MSDGRSGPDVAAIAALAATVDEIVAEVGFSGAVRIDIDGAPVVQRAYGWAHRGLAVPNTIDTLFAAASATKGLTALTVMSLVERGELRLDTTARALLGDDLPEIDDRVTVEHLLSHTSGIGDYLDEELLDDENGYVMTVPVHELATTEQYLAVLDGYPTKFEPGARFAYCNGGYVVLALLAERAAGTTFHDLVVDRVCQPAGMVDTAFLRSDELPGRAALGYLDGDGPRTNVFHLPVRGTGDGGVYTTAADVHALWDAMLAGRIVAPDTVAEMLRPRTAPTDDALGYGLGFWLAADGAVVLMGGDVGVGFRSTHHPQHRTTVTALGNQTAGTTPTARRINQLVAELLAGRGA